MTRSFKRIDEQATALCRDVVEASGCRISAAVLFDYHQRAGERSIEARVLKADTHDPVAGSAGDHDDEAVSLTWTPEHGGYGYFSLAAGWVAVPAERLQQFHVDIDAMILCVASICRHGPPDGTDQRCAVGNRRCPATRA